MSEAIEMQGLIQRIGWPISPSEQRPFRIERAARKLGVSLRTAKAYWYGERQKVPSRDMDKARRLASAPTEEAAHELSELRDRIARLEAALALADADFHCPSVDAYRAVVGGLHSAMD